MDLVPKQRAVLLFSHLRQQVPPVLGGELSGEQLLWLAVTERALFDLAATNDPLAYDYLTRSARILEMGLTHEWIGRLLKRYGLTPGT